MASTASISQTSISYRLNRSALKYVHTFIVLGSDESVTSSISSLTTSTSSPLDSSSHRWASLTSPSKASPESSQPPQVEQDETMYLKANRQPGFMCLSIWYLGL